VTETAAERDITIAFTPTQLLLTAVALFVIVRLIRRARRG
jgi:hypothetical protein